MSSSVQSKRQRLARTTRPLHQLTKAESTLPSTTRETTTTSEATSSASTSSTKSGAKSKAIWNKEADVFSGVPVAFDSTLMVEPGRECARYWAMRALRKQLDRRCMKSSAATVAPVLSFERWHARALLSKADDCTEPLIPMHQTTDAAINDSALATELERAGIVDAAIASQLSNASVTAGRRVQALKEPADLQVKVARWKHSTDVSLSTDRKSVFKLNNAHYEKLWCLYQRHALGRESASVDEDEGGADKEDFHRRLSCLLMRYSSLGGDGFQAALPEQVFDVLRSELGVQVECFASPLNAHFPVFGSAFPDVDGCFGSLGSFFDWSGKITGGSFEVNPPFVSQVMEEAAKRVLACLQRTEKQKKQGAVSFVVVLPGWVDEPAWRLLSKSKFCVLQTVVAKTDHGFCDGAQHKRQDRYRESPFDTGVFILQNTAGKSAWPVSAQLEEHVRSAFAEGLPTAGMKLRRLKAARGFADADGGGGVYKGKKRGKPTEEKPKKDGAKKAPKKPQAAASSQPASKKTQATAASSKKSEAATASKKNAGAPSTSRSADASSKKPAASPSPKKVETSAKKAAPAKRVQPSASSSSKKPQAASSAKRAESTSSSKKASAPPPKKARTAAGSKSTIQQKKNR